MRAAPEFRHGSIATLTPLLLFLPLAAASTPAPQQTSSSDCPHSQASEAPTDHSPDLEGQPGSAKGEDQSVSSVAAVSIMFNPSLIISPLH